LKQQKLRILVIPEWAILQELELYQYGFRHHLPPTPEIWTRRNCSIRKAIALQAAGIPSFEEWLEIAKIMDDVRPGKQGDEMIKLTGNDLAWEKLVFS
jgi:hypothetical protein